MWQTATSHHDTRRRHFRHAIATDCVLVFDEHTVRCRTRDLSYGGARVTMPLPATSYALTSLRSLHLRGVGFIRVSARWHSDRDIGLEFDNAQHFRGALHQMIQRSGASLRALRPIGG